MLSNKSEKAICFGVLITSIIIIFSIVLVIFFSKTAPFVREGNYSQYFPNKQIKVVIFGTVWCQACSAARSYLKQKNVEFVDYDIEQSEFASQQYKQLAADRFPVILIGNKQIRGFHARTIDDALIELSE